MNNKIYLKNLDFYLKLTISAFLLIIGIGISTGLIYINYTTGMSSTGTLEQYRGSIVEQYDIPEKFPKDFESMILTTHEHIISFSIITLILSIIFSFNSIITGKIKLFFMLEPFISIFLTFSSMWLMRYISSKFVYFLIFSSGLMYLCWYVMILVSLYDLNRK